jgi:hypothetical protein
MEAQGFTSTSSTTPGSVATATCTCCGASAPTAKIERSGVPRCMTSITSGTVHGDARAAEARTQVQPSNSNGNQRRGHAGRSNAQAGSLRLRGRRSRR